MERVSARLETWIGVSLLLHMALAAWLGTRTVSSTMTVSAKPATVRVAWLAPQPLPEPEADTPLPAPPSEPEIRPPKPVRRSAVPPPAPPKPRPVPETVPAHPPRLPAVAAANPPAAATTPAPSAEAVDSYVERVQRMIDAHKRYPPMARRRGIEGSVTIEVAIGPGGAVESIERVGDSAKIFWEPSRRAVEAAAPFPAPPEGAIRIVFPLRYELD